MKVILSPAMGFNQQAKRTQTLPQYIEKTHELVGVLQTLSPEDIACLMKCSDKIAQSTFELYQTFYDQVPRCAAEFFDGTAYKALDAQSLSTQDAETLNNKTFILSGLYGVVKPYEGIYSYRLELKTKLKVSNYKNLYDFWGDSWYKALCQENAQCIVNLASKEYAKAIEPYLKSETFVTCTFKTQTREKLKMCSVRAKHMRGLMARYIAQEDISDFEDLTSFDLEGYHFSEQHSHMFTQKPELVFIKNESK